MSYVLVMESSISGVAMAIQSVESQERWSGSHIENMGSAKAIGSLAQEGLDSLGISPIDIKGVCVSVGPGSFTGIKVGLSFISGFSAGRDDLVFLGLSGIEAANRRLCENHGKSGRLFLRATRTHGYGSSFNKGKHTTMLVNATDDAVFRESVISLAQEEMDFTVGEWPQLESVLTADGRKVNVVSIAEVSDASVYGMCLAAQEQFPNGYSKQIPGPNYMRLSTAEEQLGREVKGKKIL